MNLNYFLIKMPKNPGKYIPNTKPADNYSVKKFLLYLSRKNPQIPLNTYKDVLNAMTETVEDILSEGSSITIPGIIRIAPVVKGVFDSATEPFNSYKHKIGINFIALTDFIFKVANRIKVKRIKTPQKLPSIQQVLNNKTKSNALHLNYANMIYGAYFLKKKEEFTGFTLLSASFQDKSIIIKKNELDLIKISKKQIIFNFKRDFAPPDWLVNDYEIFINLRYKNSSGRIAQYQSYQTR
ncbi:MAG: hypothetical protein JXB50_12555, partial [Spirochaetes bacterium]|nr:hypothetical protein [Spirochaetota bacterium]